MERNARRCWFRTLAVGGLTVVGLGATSARAQPEEPKAKREGDEPPRPDARPGDVGSVDAIVKALYETISGPAGPRDWNRLRSLFAPGARLIVAVAPPNAKARLRTFTVEEFISAVTKNSADEGFFESEIARRTESFGHIAHVFSTYESRHAPGEKPFARGINSFQLFHDGDRWSVVTIYWDSERPGQPIPPEFLKNG